MAILIFVAIAIVSAMLWHSTMASFGSAVLAATVTTVVLFQAAAYLEAGHLDSMAGIAIVTTAVISAIISVIVGLLIRAKRKARSNSAP